MLIQTSIYIYMYLFIIFIYVLTEILLKTYRRKMKYITNAKNIEVEIISISLDCTSNVRAVGKTFRETLI